jgi:hypothetical protein
MNEIKQLKNLMESVSKPNFQQISYEQFERVVQSSDDYSETEIDGYRVIAAYTNNNCIALYYNKAGIASVNSEHNGDALGYSEVDPYWPYGDG